MKLHNEGGQRAGESSLGASQFLDHIIIIWDILSVAKCDLKASSNNHYNATQRLSDAGKYGLGVSGALSSVTVMEVWNQFETPQYQLILTVGEIRKNCIT